MTKTRILLILSLILLGFFGILPAAHGTYVPLETINILLWEDTENERTTVTVFGFIDPNTPLPAEVSFYFVEDYELSLLDQLPAGTNLVVEQNALEYSTAPSDLEDFENLTKYTFTLTEGHSFVAGFSIGVSLFEFGDMMGGLPIGTFSFVPPNDLRELGIGFVSPSLELVGAGPNVLLIGEADEGEIYGVILENVPGGELQEIVIAFGARESRDAALAEAAGISEEATPTALDWLTTTTGMIVVGSAAVLLVAVALFIVVMRRNKDVVVEDDDFDDENEPVDDSENGELADAEGDPAEEK